MVQKRFQDDEMAPQQRMDSRVVDLELCALVHNSLGHCNVDNFPNDGVRFFLELYPNAIRETYT